MAHEEWLERTELYALGALEAGDARRVEAHVAGGCPACERRLAETREGLALLARALPPLDPPAELRARVLAAVEQEPVGAPVAPAPRAPRAAPRPLWWGLGAGALAAAGLLAALGWALATTRQELARLEARAAALRAELARQQEALRVLADPGARVVTLAGTGPSPTASARLFWNPPTGRGVLVTSGLPPLPGDRVYELWAIAGAEPLPAGIFTVDAAGRAVHPLPALPPAAPVERFAVTLEPAGGLPRPSGPMHLLGAV